MFVLGCKVEPLRFAPHFPSGQILAKNSQTTFGHIWALTYTTPHSHSMNMFNRPFDQFRICQSCSLPFSNLKQVHDHRSGVNSPRYFHTTHSASNYFHQIYSLFQMLQPSIAHCYVEIIEDLSLLHWLPQKEYSSTQKLLCLGTLWFRLISEEILPLLLLLPRLGKTGVEFITLTGLKKSGEPPIQWSHHWWGRREWPGYGDSLLLLLIKPG